VKKTDFLKCKNWMKYEPYLLSGEWHVHTNYTDGNNSVAEYCEQAIKSRVPLVVFSEHVRRNLDYNFHSLLEEIEVTQKKYPELIILSGCEVKVLETGGLDVSDEVLKQSEIVLMAFHSFPVDEQRYYSALKTALTNPNVDIWAHPGLFLARNGLRLNRSQIGEISSIAFQNNVLIELNAKYNMPPREWINIWKGTVRFVRGSDIHGLRDFERGSWNAI